MTYITATEARKILRVSRKFFMQLADRHTIEKKDTGKKYKIPQYLYLETDIQNLKKAGFRHPHKLHFDKCHNIGTPHFELPGSVDSNFTSHVTAKGYREVHYPQHPNSNSSGQVPHHQLVMERHLQRYLTKVEVVHHRDGNTLHNHIDNLILYSDKSEHLKMGHGIQLKLRTVLYTATDTLKRESTLAKVEKLLDNFIENTKK
jgi:hypothetical protein